MDNNRLIILVFAIGCLTLFCFGMLFISRAIRNFSEKKPHTFKPLLYVQGNYDKMRKTSRIPCGILYVKSSCDESNPIGGHAGHEKTDAYFEETLIASFDKKDDVLSRVKSGEYLVITKTSEAGLVVIIEQIRHAMQLFARTHADAAVLAVNFGAYLIPANSIQFEEAVSRARLAAVEAENTKKGYVAWDYHLQNEYDNKKMVEDKLKDGVKNNNFFLEFQPIINISNGNIVGGEVLTRFNGDTGILQPADFISAVKSKKMDAEFDCWVFEKVCRYLSLHREACQYLNTVSVNLSRLTLSTEGIAETLLELIREYNVEPSRISVELLEESGDGNYDTDRIKENLSALKANGMTVYLDDFGDGSTSFDDLKNYSIDAIKISKTITDNIDSQVGERIFKGIVSVAASMGVYVVCEGIERANQIEMLKKTGVFLVQGYYFYKPLSPAQFEQAIMINRTKQESAL